MRTPRAHTPISELLARLAAIPPATYFEPSAPEAANWALLGFSRCTDVVEADEATSLADVYNQHIYDSGASVLGPDGYVRRRVTLADGGVYHDSMHLDDWVRAYIVS